MEKTPEMHDPLVDLSETPQSRLRCLRDFIAASVAHIAFNEELAAVYAAAFGKFCTQESFSADDLFAAFRTTDQALDRKSLPSYFGIQDRLPAQDFSLFDNLIAFLSHDITHMDEVSFMEHANQVATYCRPDGIEILESRKVPLAPEWAAMYRALFNRLDSYLRQAAAPHQFLKALCEMQLRRPVTEVEPIGLAEMARNIITSLQLRFVFDDYVVTSSETRQKERNEIVLDTVPVELITNPGMLWSVLYNLMKNAGKELTIEHTGANSDEFPLVRRWKSRELPKKPNKLHIKIEKVSDQKIVVIHVGDSGQGLAVDEIMRSLSAILHSGLLDQSDLKKSARRIVEAWDKNPFAVRALRLGDVYDMAGIARASGFATRERLRGQFSSGMGLWGVNYLVGKMGGQIIYTKKAEGGALFTILLPTDYFGASERSGVKGTVRKLRRSIEAGGLFLEYPRAA